MPDLNKVYLIGNLTRDPELKHLPSGTALCNFGLAVNRRYSTARGEDREDVCFVDVEAWGRQAETVSSYLRKGSPALVEGRLKYDQWDDRETGRRRSRLLVHAERIQFLGSPASGGSSFGQSEDTWERDSGSSPSGSRSSSNGMDMPPFEELPNDDPPGSVPF